MVDFGAYREGVAGSVDKAAQGLNAQVQELRKENAFIKAELCKMDNSYSFCK